MSMPFMTVIISMSWAIRSITACKVELDSHADTSVEGVNCLIIHVNDRQFNIYGCNTRH